MLCHKGWSIVWFILFQPMCGTFSSGKRSKANFCTEPCKMPKQSTPPFSSLVSISTCKPIQIPKKGFSVVASLRACTMPVLFKACIQALAAPCPGKMIASALRMSSGLLDINIFELLFATCIAAFDTERKLPMP